MGWSTLTGRGEFRSLLKRGPQVEQLLFEFRSFLIGQITHRLAVYFSAFIVAHTPLPR